MEKFQMAAFWGNVRQLLFSHRSKEFFVFLFFLAVSAGFWLLQVLDDTFEMEITVPLQLTEVPKDVVITSPLPSQLSVTIKDKGTSLVRYWRHQVKSVSLSFEDYEASASNGRVKIPLSDVTKIIQDSILASSKVQSVHPDVLEFYFNHGFHASIPVKISGKVDTNPHFYLLEVKTDPEFVQVYASSTIIDSLSSVSTMPVNLTDLKENTTVEVALRPIRGAKTDPQKVKLTAMVDVYMENTIEVPIVSLNFPGDLQLRTFPSSVKVTYTVGYARSKEVTQKNFVSVITYEELLALQEQHASKIPIRLKSIPLGVKNVRIEPQEVDYLVESIASEE